MALTTLTIYHTNDLHDRRQALRRVERLPREGPTLLVDAGDAIGGSNTAFRLREPVLVEMSRLGYSAMALGNREFHYLRQVMEARAREADFPLLAANLEDLTGRVSSLVLPRVVLRAGQLRVGLLGLTPVQFPEHSFWTRVTGFRFRSPRQALEQWVPGTARECDLVVVLSHAGLPVDEDLAREVPGINLIIGGHTHAALAEPRRVGDTWIVSAGSHGSHVGKVVLGLEPDQAGNKGCRVASLEAVLIPVDA